MLDRRRMFHERYGNLVTYYRLNKMVLPESRPRR